MSTSTTCAAALSLCLLASSAAHAVTIGDITPTSRMGEPLLAFVELTAQADAAHDQRDQSRPPASTRSGTEWEIRAGDTLTGIARLIYPNQPLMRDKLIRAIVATNPDAFPDGKPDHVIVGTVIVIPDLRTIGPVAASPVSPASEAPIPVPKPPRKPKSGEGMGADAVAAFDKPTPTAHDGTAASKPKQPAVEAPLTLPREQTAPGKPDTGFTFRLRLSTGAMDLSAVGKLSEEERKLLRERQLLLDTDDQMASFLALKHQIKQLETQVIEMRLKLDRGEIRAVPPALAPVVTKPATPAVSTITAAARTPASDTLEIIKYALTLYLLPAAEITLAILALFFILRYYRNLRGQLAESGELAAAQAGSRHPVLTEAREATANISTFDKSVAIATAAQIQVVDDVDTILQDAQLFVIHGHQDKAIELLEDQIAANRGEVRVWMLLFVILRSQGMKKEFEKLARRFKGLALDPGMWESIQELGHELEADNPLYLNEKNRRTAVTTAASARSATAAVLFPGGAAAAGTPVDSSVGPAEVEMAGKENPLDLEISEPSPDDTQNEVVFDVAEDSALGKDAPPDAPGKA